MVLSRKSPYSCMDLNSISQGACISHHQFNHSIENYQNKTVEIFSSNIPFLKKSWSPATSEHRERKTLGVSTTSAHLHLFISHSRSPIASGWTRCWISGETSTKTESSIRQKSQTCSGAGTNPLLQHCDRTP